MTGILDSIDSSRQTIRRGELDTPMPTHVRSRLHSILLELEQLQRQAKVLGNDFLAYVIGTAADEARDQLRDDLIIRNENAENGTPHRF